MRTKTKLWLATKASGRGAVYALSALTMLIMVATTACSQLEEPTTNNEADKAVKSTFVGLDEALSYADAMFAQLDEDTRSSDRTVANVSILQDATRADDADAPAFYIVNYDNDQGFAILSADSRTDVPVYAISDEGSLNLNDTVQNEGLKQYLDAICATPLGIPGGDGDQWTIDPNYDPDDIPFKTGRLYKDVRPLFTSYIHRWKQTDPFNRYCFTKTGKQANVGCEAIATAQIMAYYKHPLTHSALDTNAPKTYVFDWEGINNGSNEDCLAHLLEILGRPSYLNIDYETNSCSPNSLNVIMALQNFDYDIPTYSGFDLKVATKQLASKNPLYIAGDGHAWTIDGFFSYQSDISDNPPYVAEREIYLHFVWGAGGTCNGFYYYDKAKKGTEKNAVYYYKDDREDIELTPLDKFYHLREMIYNFRKLD